MLSPHIFLRCNVDRANTGGVRLPSGSLAGKNPTRIFGKHPFKVRQQKPTLGLRRKRHCAVLPRPSPTIMTASTQKPVTWGEDGRQGQPAGDLSVSEMLLQAPDIPLTSP